VPRSELDDRGTSVPPAVSFPRRQTHVQGEWVNGPVKVLSIPVWQAIRLPSATMIPRRMVRSSKAARIDWKYSVSPA
jgi:hypothetical protein